MLPKDLIEKYQTWKGDTFSKNKDRFEKLAEEGQSPQYMIISCVDSRVCLLYTSPSPRDATLSGKPGSG